MIIGYLEPQGTGVGFTVSGFWGLAAALPDARRVVMGEMEAEAVGLRLLACWGYMGLCRGYIGIMENRIETTIVDFDSEENGFWFGSTNDCCCPAAALVGVDDEVEVAARGEQKTHTHTQKKKKEPVQTLHLARRPRNI